MPIPPVKPERVKEIHAFIQDLLVRTKDTSSEVLLNGLMSAYFSVAVNRGFAADVPAALRAAADTVEKELNNIVTAKALIDAQGATKN
ncbi:hypothetical protein [Comamonas terrigena]|uniref:hypothetical protein n=1 Tax=Comamonas terrigena TaxID=32013 RepID=UPI0028A66B38|nr:hypothetical protein [Comamonas terrigena]